MARWISRTSLVKRVFARFRVVGVVVAILATIWPVASANGMGLVAPPLDKAAKPVNPVANVPGAKMAENVANAPAGGAAAAPATGAPAGGGTNTLMKYGPSYVLMALSIGLGTFIICRPKWGAAPKTAAK